MTVLWEWGFEGTPTLFSFFSGFLCDIGLLVFQVTTDLGKNNPATGTSGAVTEFGVHVTREPEGKEEGKARKVFEDTFSENFPH